MRRTAGAGVGVAARPSLPGWGSSTAAALTAARAVRYSRSVLQLREDQLDVLMPPRAEFVAQTCAHVAAIWRAECARLGPAALEQHVRTAITRARRYGFDRKGPARRFVELVMTFGPELEQLPWAREPLTRPRPDIDALWRAAMAELER